MTNEEKAQEEFLDVIRWAIDEEDKVEARLKKEDIPSYGLDANREYYTYITKEMDRRVDEIREKYGIKPKNEQA